MRALVITHDSKLSDVDDTSLEALQGYVRGYIEVICGTDRIIIYANEDGRSLKLPKNEFGTYILRHIGAKYDQKVPTGLRLLGNIVICGAPDESGETTHVPSRVIEEVRQLHDGWKAVSK